MNEQNKQVYQEWMEKFAPIYREKFQKFFYVPKKYIGTNEEKGHGVDKFINSIGTIILNGGKDEFALPMKNGVPSNNMITYDQLLGAFGNIKIEKVNAFLDSICEMLDYTKNRSSLLNKVDDNEKIKYEEAFPDHHKNFNGAKFVTKYLMEESKLSCLSELIDDDLLIQCISQIPKRESALNLYDSLTAGIREYERKHAKYRDENAPKTENVPSNDMSKLFAGSSSELGKGINKKVSYDC